MQPLSNHTFTFSGSVFLKLRFIEWLCVAGILVAYISHLGYTPLDNETDEARRALVTAEMMLSKNYLVPTLNGELYLNKPPLYNWIVSLYFRLSGGWSMFAFRLPVIVATFILGGLTFKVVKKYTNHTIAFFTAFAYITNGRILLYDSLQGLIDTTFAITVYGGIMLIFIFGEQKKYYQLFIFSYLLCATGFLLKGIPAVVFQGFSLLTYFVIKKDFKRIFYPAHFAGVAVFLVVLATYYYYYFAATGMPPQQLFLNLLHETTQKSAIAYKASRTIINIFTFPFELLYHFAPWTILILACFNKKVWHTISHNLFLKYTFWVMLCNLSVYWLSPEVYARYLLMFVPLFFSLLFYSYFQLAGVKNWSTKAISITIKIIGVILVAASLALPFITATNNVAHVYIKAIFLLAGFLYSLRLMTGNQKWLLYGFALSIVFLRFAFNWFVVEQRGKRYFAADAISSQIVTITANRPLYILTGADAGNTDGLSFQVSTGRGAVLTKKPGIEKDAFYIVDKKQILGKNYRHYLTFTNPWAPDSLLLVTFK